MSNAIQEIIDSLAELKRLHQLNFELFKQLNVVAQWILDNHIPIPNKELLCSLLDKSLTLQSEIQAKTPKTLQYQTLANEKKQGNETEEEGTVPKMLNHPICTTQNKNPKMLQNKLNSQVTTFHMNQKLMKVTKTSQNQPRG